VFGGGDSVIKYRTGWARKISENHKLSQKKKNLLLLVKNSVAKSVAIVKRKKKVHNKSKSLDQGRSVVPTAA